ncbi:expressed unknown protein [Seminavis robusta]|uniref:Uncharacterized protein n=1 Tax=Seminavis robusta TaxID=568900 RepID=A0A9N8DZ15_9STRA|nr:expressed unknown protein [Seminavis robusta]|eukprot:Sro403_g135730.1 n/a (321) ;mRNA; f:48866-49916
MVVVGGFSVRLVEALTKTPFLELAHNGTIYAEVEPDAEYLIEVEYVGDDIEGTVLYEWTVDGKEVDFQKTLDRSSPPYLIGLPYRDEEGVRKKVAWRFAKTTRISGNSTGSNAGGGTSTGGSNNIFGTVVVDIYDTLEAGRKKPYRTKPKPYTPNFEESPPPRSPSPTEQENAEEPKPTKKDEKKRVRSIVGETKVTKSYRPMQSSSASHTVIIKKAEARIKAPPKKNMAYKIGKRLQQIEIKYRTTVGLIHEGVLATPPFWDMYRLECKAKGSNQGGTPMEDMSHVPRKTIRFNARYDGGLLVCPAKKVDLFDLTGLDD